MKQQLPERPNWDQLKKQAKNLLDDVESGRPEALARLNKEDRATFALHDAQRILAREYGFDSWPKLKLHVETRTEEAAEERLIQAAMHGDTESIRTILTERPGLGRRSIVVAAALGDVEGVASWLARNSRLATDKLGPNACQPLVYACFGRTGGEEARVEIVRMCLANGGDPNSNWTDPHWPDSPQAPLYGATGVNNHPRLARVLLEAGANPNDCESRYHAPEANHVESLAVLREFGTDFSGRDQVWGNTPLYFLFGWYKPAPAVRDGIKWLLEHGADPNVPSYLDILNELPLHLAVRNSWERDLVELLLAHGADPAARRGDGRTAYALAVRGGRDDIAALLQSRGVPADAGPVDYFLGACMRADAMAARSVLTVNLGLLASLTPDDQRVVHEAAKRELPEALALMADLGLDLAVTAEHNGETALHLAAWHGQAKAVASLIRVGVPLDVHDTRFDAPPIGWCAHGSQFCRDPDGDYPAVATQLIMAGAVVPPQIDGSPEVMAVIRRHLKNLKNQPKN